MFSFMLPLWEENNFYHIFTGLWYLQAENFTGMSVYLILSSFASFRDAYAQVDIMCLRYSWHFCASLRHVIYVRFHDSFLQKAKTNRKPTTRILSLGGSLPPPKGCEPNFAINPHKRSLNLLLSGVKPLDLFMPKIVVFEPAALKYPLGEKIYAYFKNKPVEIIKSSLAVFSRRLTEYTEKQRYAYSKIVLAVTRNQQKKLDVCKPSADYEFALVSNCPGSCEYCYLQTNQSYKPYLKAYVNLEEIWDMLQAAIPPDVSQPVTFEAASNVDPLAIEHITGSVGETIEFFGRLEMGRLRIVTKFNNADLIAGIGAQLPYPD